MRAAPTKSFPDTCRAVLGSMLKFAHREIALVSILMLAAGGVWAFIAIASEMAEGEADAIDKMLLLALRNPANPDRPWGPPWLQEAALEITALGSVTVLSLITLATVAWLLLIRKYSAALLVAIAVGGGALLSSLLKNGFARARPDLVPHGDVVTSLSFPSGHAMSSAVVYLTLAALLARVQQRHLPRVYLLSFAVALTLLIGVSRVYLGVHWPSDVLAGWCVGSAWALLCWAIASRWMKES